jgi:hypothetical protein
VESSERCGVELTHHSGRVEKMGHGEQSLDPDVFEEPFAIVEDGELEDGHNQDA